MDKDIYFKKYKEYFNSKLINENFENKEFYLGLMNKIEYTKEESLNITAIHLVIYRDFKIDLLDFGNFYRCLKNNLPIDGWPL